MAKEKLEPKYITSIAGEYGYSRINFWTQFTAENLCDMIMLGYRPQHRLIPPMAVKYIQEVVMERKPRLTVFSYLPFSYEAKIPEQGNKNENIA